MREDIAQRVTTKLVLNSTITTTNAVDAYRRAINHVLSYGHSVPAQKSLASVGHNRETREVLNFSLHIEEPTDRLFPSNPPRSINMRYALGNFLWQIFGRRDLAFIAHYNQRGKDFSDDGFTLYGAYGPRLMWQLEAICEQLVADPSSRRAVAHIHQPSDIPVASKDIPCPIALQFFIREDKLQMITMMRSQSILMVLPYDLILMTMLQEMVAVILGIDIGEYTHICTSAHIYDDELVFAKAVQTSLQYASGPLMPRMGMYDFSSRIMACVEDYEETNRIHLGESVIGKPNTPFWDWFGEQLGWWNG